MDLEKSSVWGSLKQRTKPLLQNLSVRRTKKSSTKLIEKRQIHPLDRRLSSSVPDVLNIETKLEEETHYSRAKAMSTYFPSGFSAAEIFLETSSNSSTRQTEEEWQWRKEETVRLEIGVQETEELVVSAPDLEERRKSSEDFFELLQRNTFNNDITEDPLEALEGAGDGLSKPSSFAYLLMIHLKEGRNLVIRDRCGTSDPYVKFKLNGKTLYKSKVVYKNLNPVWDETVVLPIQSLDQNLWVKVYDRDLTSSDFMGSAVLMLHKLELNRTTEMILKLEDPNSLEDDMGVIVLNLRLVVKSCDIKRNASFMRTSRLVDTLQKNQLWNGTVTVALLEGRNIPTGGMTHIFVWLKMGQEKFKSQTLCKSANPQWREQFDFHYFSDRKDVLEIEIWGKDNKKHEEILGICKFDIGGLSEKQANRLELPLEKRPGFLMMVISVAPCLGVSISDLCVCPLGDPNERKQIVQRYSFRNSFQNMKDIGFLQVKLLKAVDLLAADFSGKSDPFCVLELGNSRLQSYTVYKNLNPEWNQVFTFPIKDIHDILEVMVFDEDGDKPPDFLGKVAIPLLSVRLIIHRRKPGDGKQNVIRASVRTFSPRERRSLEDNRKFSKKILSRNVDRVKRISMAMWNTIRFLRSCFHWESPIRSMIAFVVSGINSHT
ncbi:Multiple C2 and transmembrane domain-containing protein 2 [Ophiophagus hannah]|uniref:Multiple C2 and transmembrane domain-containing protein 2 n=1 Tax=Ophiophagus hannah TaxID=8665 RepID=V8NFZ0_OPHHA|nr:Multiple C2 and transmembrane domain-containing protein 2 [Ophiophagus hannah]